MMLPNQAEYVMTRRSSRKYGPCGKCKHPVKPFGKYIIDPADTTVIYHAECYKQLYRRQCK